MRASMQKSPLVLGRSTVGWEDVELHVGDKDNGVAAATSTDSARHRAGRQGAGRIGFVVLVLVEAALVSAALYGAWYVLVNNWHLLSHDVVEYRQYAEQFWLRHPRFRSLPVEYPPLAIAPFSLTLLPPWWDPWVTFALWMGAATVLLYFAIARFTSRRSAVACLVYLLLGATAVFLGRYDLVPALTTVASLWAAQRRRFTLAYALLSIGTLLKLYPAFLLPVVAIEQWRWAWGEQPPSVPLHLTGGIAAIRSRLRDLTNGPAGRRVLRGLAVAAAIIAVGFVVSFILSPSGTLSEFKYAKDRPLQVESVPATLLWLGTFLGFQAHPIFSFQSYNYVGMLDGILKDLSAAGLVAGCIWMYIRQLKGNLSLSRAMLATLCIVVASNKVFSAQYLIWLVPLAAEVDGFSLLWVAICVLTTYEYPIIYNTAHNGWAVAYNTKYLVVVALRNALLLVATVRAAIGGSGKVMGYSAGGEWKSLLLGPLRRALSPSPATAAPQPTAGIARERLTTGVPRKSGEG